MERVDGRPRLQPSGREICEVSSDVIPSHGQRPRVVREPQPDRRKSIQLNRAVEEALRRITARPECNEFLSEGADTNRVVPPGHSALEVLTRLMNEPGRPRLIVDGGPGPEPGALAEVDEGTPNAHVHFYDRFHSSNPNPALTGT